MINLVAVGDIMPGGVLHNDTEFAISHDVTEILASGDIRIGTLECAIGNEPVFFAEKMKRLKDVIYAPDRALVRLAELGIDLVSLANNHFSDLGESGAQHTIELLDKIHVLHCGAGRNLEEASRPAVIEIKGRRIAFLGFCDYDENAVGFVPMATATTWGVNPMYEDYAIAEIKKNKALYDHVIVIPHWGTEHTYWPDTRIQSLARKMIRAGASCILGGHSHRVQPVIRHREGAIAYSMGNFLFPDRYIVAPRSTWYPPADCDLTNVPVTYEYPYVREPTLKRWKKRGQIGMIVRIKLSEKVMADYFLTSLSDNKILRTINGYGTRIILNGIGVLLRTSIYPLFHLIHRIIQSIVYRIKHLKVK